MKIRSFIIAYALVLAILVFADRRPDSSQASRYSHVVDLTNGDLTNAATAISQADFKSTTRIIAPGSLIPGTWSAGQIPAQRLVAPLVVIDLSEIKNVSAQLSLDDISAWESKHGMIPQGAVVAIRRNFRDRANVSLTQPTTSLPITPLPITSEAGSFLVNARYTIGLAVENPVNMAADRKLSEEIALRGSYVLEGVSNFASLPTTGSLIIVAPEKAAPEKAVPGKIATQRRKKQTEVPVRILAMVR